MSGSKNLCSDNGCMEATDPQKLRALDESERG